jgi:hypothetical protein
MVLMPHTDDPDDPATLTREIQDSRSYQIYLRLQTLRINYFVFHRNYEELKMLVMAAQHPNTFDQIWAPDKPQEMTRILGEMIRMLHNLIASAKTLVEHTRILIKDWYPDSEFLREYNAEIRKRFVGNSLIGFVEDMRNYALHYRLPLVTARFEVNTKPDTGKFTEKQLILLEKAKLLN